MKNKIPIRKTSRRRVAPPSFILEEATVSSIQASLASGRVTCVNLVQMYLDRIAAYDKIGPALNSILTINPKVLETARRMDAQYKANPSSVGPLHCIPTILKDNYDTADMPTSGGSIAMAQSQPLKDAFLVRRLRKAGALIIAKSNLTELARGGTTVSSLGGQTRNPYDLTRTPGGSSGGTGASIAANFAAVGTGSDTGQSVRSPASAQSLVGIRATRGLLSRDGIIPVSTTQDEAGPITRTVTDAALMLDAMAGYDPADPITAFSLGKIPKSYIPFLDANGLQGARIGLLIDFMGKDAVHKEVNAVVQTAAKKMEEMGATVIPLSIPNLAQLTDNIAVSNFEFKSAFNKYLTSLGPNAPVKSLDEFIADGKFHPSIQKDITGDQAIQDGMNRQEYKNRMLRREVLRQAVMAVMADHRLDAILYPHQRRLVAAIGEDQLERNGVLSNSTGFPGITFPGGFSSPTISAPLGVPIGIELLGPEWSEGILLKFAYAFEQGAKVRKPPTSTPPLAAKP